MGAAVTRARLGRLVVASLCLSSLLACGQERPADRVARMARLSSTHHAIPADALASLDDADLAALRSLARDRERPLWLRLRALVLAGARPSEETRALWAALRQAPERELRVQAAWAEGLSRAGRDRVTYAAGLLDDGDEALREAGAHLLAIATKNDERRVLAIARARLPLEGSERVRAVLRRKVLEGER